MKILSGRIEALRESAASAAAPQPGKPRIVRVLHIFSCLCGASLLLLGLGVLLAWLFNYQPAIQVLPGYITMKPNTAVLFVLSAISLLLTLTSASPVRLWARILALLTCALALFTLSEYLFHVNLRIDQLILADRSQQPFPGRMAPITAINFTIAGISLFLLTGASLQRKFAHALGLVLAALSITSIVGFLYGVSTFYGSGTYTSMAFHTGIGFLVLSIGLILAVPSGVTARMLSAPGVSGWLTRRALPAVVILPVLVGYLYLKGPLEMSSLRLGMAIFAVSLVAAGAAGLWLVSLFLSRAERQRAEIDHIREAATAAIRQSEHELRIVTDQLPTLISYVDNEGRFIRVNRTYEQWTGLTSSEIVGRSIRDLLGEQYWQETATYREAALSGSTITFEIDYPTRSGPRRTQVTYAPDLVDHASHSDSRGAGYQVRGIVCMVLDIEEQRRAEQAIRQSEKLAVVGRLASSIAHEINNPLEAVTNLMYLAERDSPPGSAPAAYLAQAQQELARVTHIVVQTLRFHRQSTRPVLSQPAELSDQILALYAGRLAQARIQVHRRYRATEPILCREGEIRQVLANLIGNSAEAMAGTAAAETPRLYLRTRAATCLHTGRSGIRITVADTGHGIGEQTRKTLFQPFHTTKGATGSGLGLWVSKEIIDRHGGHFTVRSSTHPTRHHTVFSIFIASQAEIPSTPAADLEHASHSN